VKGKGKVMQISVEHSPQMTATKKLEQKYPRGPKTATNRQFSNQNSFLGNGKKLLDTDADIIAPETFREPLPQRIYQPSPRNYKSVVNETSRSKSPPSTSQHNHLSIKQVMQR